MSTIMPGMDTVVALFTVCADAALNELASQMPHSMTTVQFAGEFQQYISASQRPHFPPSMRNAPCCVALIDFDKDIEAALETAETLHTMASPRVTCVGVSATLDTETLLRAMRAGCNEFLQKPADSAHLSETLARIQGRLFLKLESSGARGRVLSIFGAKGGVGTTTLAVHLASYLVKRYSKKTLLIDHYHQLGHACLYLGLKESNYHFDDLIRNVDRLDADLLQGFLVRHASGLAVIASPDTCTARPRTSYEDLERIFDFLRREYDYIILDSSLQYEETAAAMIRLSDHVYLVSTPDVAALRDLSRHIENLSLSEMNSSRLRIVINRASSHDAIDAEQIEKVVRFPVSISVPNNYAELLKAINAGEPISAQRRSDFSTSISKWTEQVIADAGEARTMNAVSGKKRFAFWK
jgi:pilus assembly protein CpaE